MIIYKYFLSLMMQRERIAREMMIEEQDRAFRESLIADQEKVRKINNGINLLHVHVCLKFISLCPFQSP